MKKLYFIIPVFIITLSSISCQKSPEEQLISDYTQTIGKAKMDLNFKIINLEKIKDIKAKDSADLLKLTFEEERKTKLEQLTVSLESNTLLDYYQEQMEEMKQDKSYSDEYRNEQIEYYQKNIIKEKEGIEGTRKIVEVYKTDCKGTFLEPLYNKIQYYEETPDKLLATEYNVTYSIKNPMLNNAKQEINKTYFLNGDRTKVLSTK